MVDAGGGGTDAGPDMVDAGGGTDAGATDAGSMDAAVTDAGATDAGATDAGATDGGAGNAAARLRVASRSLFSALCACDFTGFADAAECSTFGQNATVDACDDMAFAANMAAAAGPLDCLATARAARATCAMAAGCDMTMLDACSDTESTAFMACADTPMAYGTSFQMCIDSDVVGTVASMCPENSPASMMTGDSVFTGDTTGAGSDAPMASCRDSFFCDTASADRAFEWTAPAAGRFIFDTAGSAFDTLLSITDGCAGTELACNDDGSGMPGIGLRSRTELVMTMGQTVTIHVAGCGSFDAGTFQVNINRMP